jgi:hypothetical protein
MREPSELRAWLFAALADAADRYRTVMRGAGEDQLAWQRRQFYVDRVRGVIVPLVPGDSFVGSPTIVESRETAGLLDAFGGRDLPVTTNELIASIAALARPSVLPPSPVAMAHLLNLTVAQPAIEPAFWPLFWLALAKDAREAAADSLYEIVGPMMIELATYPASLDQRAGAHAAQVAFARSIDPAITDAGPEVWAATCEALLASRLRELDDTVFAEVAARI